MSVRSVSGAKSAKPQSTSYALRPCFASALCTSCVLRDNWPSSAIKGVWIQVLEDPTCNMERVFEDPTCKLARQHSLLQIDLSSSSGCTSVSSKPVRSVQPDTFRSRSGHSKYADNASVYPNMVPPRKYQYPPARMGTAQPAKQPCRDCVVAGALIQQNLCCRWSLHNCAQVQAHQLLLATSKRLDRSCSTSCRLEKSCTTHRPVTHGQPRQDADMQFSWPMPRW